MNTVFADTYYFLALVNNTDQGHAKAVQFTKSYGGRLVTTPWVLTELADALASTPHGRARFLQTLAKLQSDPCMKIFACEEGFFRAGISLYGQRPDKEWSLTDCISFAVMQNERITEALTGDKHIEQAGYAALLK